MIKCDGKLTTNFTLKEVANRMSGENIELQITPEFLYFVGMMQELRDWASDTYPKYAKEGLLVSSCFRTKKYNASVGGSSNSAHLEGRAMDIKNISSAHYEAFTIAWRAICAVHGKTGGVNYYKWGMHFTDNEDKFGNKNFVIRNKR